jgi:peptidoglycan/LPS O-acetylase OafA/YrhL
VPANVLSPPRNQSLDVLRAIAVLAVIGSHSSYFPLWARIGGIGVDLFFVLSGFLVSGLLFQEFQKTGEIRIGRFLMRRGLKIWPSYYLMMAGVASLYFFNSSTMSKSQLLSNLFFIQNYAPGHPFYTILFHTWTLAVEEHFYLLLPFLLVLLISLRRDNPFALVPLLSVVIAAVCLLFRVFTVQPGNAAWATHMRADELFDGVALSYLRHFRPAAFSKFAGKYALVFAAVLISPAVLLPALTARAMQTFGLTSLGLGFMFVIAWSVMRTPKNSTLQMLVGSVAKLGVFSYSIYLWHSIFVEMFNAHPPVSFLKFWAYMASCIAFGIGMAHLVELPYLKLRDRLFSSRATTTTT